MPVSLVYSGTLILNLVRKTIVRLLVLVIALGYGVVKPTLGTTSYVAFMYGILYFIASCIDRLERDITAKHLHQYAGSLFSSIQGAIVTQDSSIASIDDVFRVLAPIPAALLDLGFYIWIFYGISSTVRLLVQRKKSESILLYVSFKLGCEKNVSNCCKTALKLTMYSQFKWALIIYASLAILAYMYKM